MTVTAQCTNPSDMEIEVKTVMSLAQWAEICGRIEPILAGQFYSPLADFRQAIKEAISHIQDRATISHPWLPPP